MPVRDWGVRHVMQWLDQECELPSYQNNFQEGSVNGAMLLQLTVEDLQESLVCSTRSTCARSVNTGVPPPLGLMTFKKRARASSEMGG